jgi:hypothetical protein
LGTRSAASPCCGNNRRLPDVRWLGLLLATVVCVPGVLLAQLTTGSIEGTLRAVDGRPVAGAPILVTGGAGFRTVINSNSNGEFTMTLPYGRYRLSGAHQPGPTSSGATIVVTPLRTTRFDLVIEASGSIRRAQPAAETPGIWTDATSGRVYPEAFSLPGLLLSREPSSVPDALCIQKAKAPPHQSAVRRVHCFFEQVLWTAGSVANVNGLPTGTAGGTAIQLRLRRVAAEAAPEDAVGTLFVRSAQSVLVQHRPDQESHARLFRPVAGRGYSGSSSASMASCAMTSDTAADL